MPPFHLPLSLVIECLLRPGPFVTIHSRVTHFINVHLDVCSRSQRSSHHQKSTDLCSGSPYAVILWALSSER